MYLGIIGYFLQCTTTLVSTFGSDVLDNVIPYIVSYAASVGLRGNYAGRWQCDLGSNYSACLGGHMGESGVGIMEVSCERKECGT